MDVKRRGSVLDKAIGNPTARRAPWVGEGGSNSWNFRSYMGSFVMDFVLI